jgi:hypothetical protein
MTRRPWRPVHHRDDAVVRVTVSPTAVIAHLHRPGRGQAPRPIALATARRLAVAGMPLVVTETD